MCRHVHMHEHVHVYQILKSMIHVDGRQPHTYAGKGARKRISMCVVNSRTHMHAQTQTQALVQHNGSTCQGAKCHKYYSCACTCIGGHMHMVDHLTLICMYMIFKRAYTHAVRQRHAASGPPHVELHGALRALEGRQDRRHPQDRAP